jgi:hypothetical protein
MKLMKLAVIAAAMVISGSALATAQSFDTGNYTVSYDDANFYNTGNWSSGDHQGFSFNIPGSFNVDQIQGTATYDLPSFTVTADAGYTLSGPFDLKIGSFGVVTFGGGSAGASMTGSFVVDGATVPLDKLALTSDQSRPKSSAGYIFDSYTLESSNSLPSFKSLSLSNGQMTLSASGPLALVFANGGSTASQFQASLYVTAVPEPDTYGMMLVGLCLVGSIAKRRKIV